MKSETFFFKLHGDCQKPVWCFADIQIILLLYFSPFHSNTVYTVAKEVVQEFILFLYMECLTD